jgi:hypothetical protein
MNRQKTAQDHFSLSPTKISVLIYGAAAAKIRKLNNGAPISRAPALPGAKQR